MPIKYRTFYVAHKLSGKSYRKGGDFKIKVGRTTQLPSERVKDFQTTGKCSVLATLVPGDDLPAGVSVTKLETWVKRAFRKGTTRRTSEKIRCASKLGQAPTELFDINWDAPGNWGIKFCRSVFAWVKLKYLIFRYNRLAENMEEIADDINLLVQTGSHHGLYWDADPLEWSVMACDVIGAKLTVRHDKDRNRWEIIWSG